MLDIEQLESWKFILKNWPRSIDLNFDQVSWIYEWDFYNIDEFDIEKAKEFYKWKELINNLYYK